MGEDTRKRCVTAIADGFAANGDPRGVYRRPEKLEGGRETQRVRVNGRESHGHVELWGNKIVKKQRGLSMENAVLVAQSTPI